jgi:hypothetical protein
LKMISFTFLTCSSLKHISLFHLVSNLSKYPLSFQNSADAWFEFFQTNLISLFSLFLSHPAQPISLARSLPLSLHVGIAQKRGHRAVARTLAIEPDLAPLPYWRPHPYVSPRPRTDVCPRARIGHCHHPPHPSEPRQL